MPSMPSSSPPMKKPVTCSRPSSSMTLVLKKPLRIAYTEPNSSPALNSASPRRRRRRAYTTFSTRSRSSMHRPCGRQSSLRLQLEQVTSNLRPWACSSTTLADCFVAIARSMDAPLLSVQVACARFERGAHAVEFGGLVVEAARAEPLGHAPVGLGGEVAEHQDLDVGRALRERAQHVEAAAVGEAQIEHYQVRAFGEDAADRLLGPVRVAHLARAHVLEHRLQPLEHGGGILDQEHA